MIIQRSWRLNKKAVQFVRRPYRMCFYVELIMGDSDPEYGNAWRLNFSEMRRIWRLS